jgi:cyclase
VDAILKKELRRIPVLGIFEGGLWKTKGFQAPIYVGDPINALKVFNEKEADEILLMGFRQTMHGRGLPRQMLSNLAGEAQMPLGYGGGIAHLDEVKWLMDTGFEKVVFNTALGAQPALIEGSAALMGSSSVVVSLDYRRNAGGVRTCFTHSGTVPLGLELSEVAVFAEELGAGELIVHHIDGDGLYTGYDSSALDLLAATTDLPLVLAGGCRGKLDFSDESLAAASGLAASSCFVFYGRHKAVLIHYNEIKD